MGIINSLKRLKLKKLQPGRLVKSATNAAAAIGIPGARALQRVENRIGQRVDSANRVIHKARAAVNQISKEQGISKGQAAGQLADRALAGAEVGLTGLAIPANAKTLIMVAGAALLIFLLMRGRK